MKIEEIRLTEKEIEDTWLGVELFDDFLAIANTATAKAIREIRIQIWNALKNSEYISITHPLYDIMKDLYDMVEEK